MRVLALVPNLLNFAPGQRSSIEAWEPILGEQGITIDYAPFETDALHSILYQKGRTGTKVREMLRAYVRRIAIIRKKTREYDAVLIYREAALIGPALLERRIAAQGIPIIYQLDDPLHIPYKSPFSSYLSYLKFFGKVKTNCRIASAVIVNSGPLRDFAEQYNDNVWQVPCVVDTNTYTYEPKTYSDRKICIGWTGSPSTAPNLRVIAEPLRRLQSRVDFRLHLIGSTEFDLPGVDYTFQPWNAATEVEDLRQIDIGLVPLPDNEWNRWKFFMKVAQYMSLGIPAVATPMGSIAEDITHGENGFLAESADDWVTYLERLVTDLELLRRFSNNAIETARKRFTVQANAPVVGEAFRSVLRTAPR